MPLIKTSPRTNGFVHVWPGFVVYSDLRLMYLNAQSVLFIQPIVHRLLRGSAGFCTGFFVSVIRMRTTRFAMILNCPLEQALIKLQV